MTPGNKIDPQLVGGESNFFLHTNIFKEKLLKDLLEKHSAQKPELVQIKVPEEGLDHKEGMNRNSVNSSHKY